MSGLNARARTAICFAESPYRVRRSLLRVPDGDATIKVVRTISIVGQKRMRSSILLSRLPHREKMCQNQEPPRVLQGSAFGVPSRVCRDGPFDVGC
jgi:hypothetical protein